MRTCLVVFAVILVSATQPNVEAQTRQDRIEELKAERVQLQARLAEIEADIVDLEKLTDEDYRARRVDELFKRLAESDEAAAKSSVERVERLFKLIDENKRQGKKPAKPELACSSWQLLKEFEDNTARANIKYKDKLIAVVGRVRGVSADTVSIYATKAKGEKLDDPNYDAIDVGKLAGNLVVCRFPESQTKAAAELNDGDIVSVIGICKGQSPEHIDFVILTDCKIELVERFKKQ